jgi:AAA+ ATPase superfamily predicted ATPase
MNDFKETFLVQFSISEVSEIEHFVGREEELAQMREQLPCDDSRKIVVLHGLGGIGKTQLAVAYAKRHRNDYSAVFWLNSKDEGTLKQSFAKMVKRIFRDHPSSTYLKTVVGSGDLDEAVNATKRWLSNPGNNRWLLVYDNYDEPKLTGNKDPRAFDIRPFLPEAYQGAIVITTRSSQVKIGYLIPMRKLQDIQHSLEILSHTSGRRDLSNGE